MGVFLLFQNVEPYVKNSRIKSAPTKLVSITPQSQGYASTNILCNAQSQRTWGLDKIMEVIRSIKERRVRPGSSEDELPSEEKCSKSCTDITSSP